MFNRLSYLIIISINLSFAISLVNYKFASGNKQLLPGSEIYNKLLKPILRKFIFMGFPIFCNISAIIDYLTHFKENIVISNYCEYLF
jgi:hypothetical protein